jgi:hypothetical protein
MNFFIRAAMGVLAVVFIREVRDLLYPGRLRRAIRKGRGFCGRRLVLPQSRRLAYAQTLILCPGKRRRHLLHGRLPRAGRSMRE